jgi:two-component system, chemotaxis family, chemotaxis protein CheY
MGRKQEKPMKNLQLTGSTILVVDDEEFMRDLIGKLLTDLEVGKIYYAASVAQAIGLLEENVNEIDCILSDFKMPGQTGIEFLQSVRAGNTPAPRDIPFAMLTAHADKFVLGLAMALDVDAFIAKPVSKNTLQKRLETVLGQARPELPPARIYSGVQLGSPVESLEARVETLEGIIRELVKTGLAPDAVDAAKARRPVWTTNTASPQDNTPVEQEAEFGTSSPDLTEPELVIPEGAPSINVALQDVPEDAVLASDLRSNSGRLILSAYSRLSQRQLDMLDNLVEMGEVIDIVEIYA